VKKFLYLLLALMAGSAAQADTRQWQGYWVGLGYGSGQITDPHIEYDAGTRNPNGFAGVNTDQSPLLTLIIGHNWRSDKMLIGLETRVQRRAYEDRAFQTYNDQINLGFAGEYSSTLSTQLIARLGRLVSERTLVYAAAGVVQTNYTRVYETVGVPPRRDVFVDSERGRLLGLGYERALNENWRLRGEISRIWYNETTHTPTVAWSGLDDMHHATENNVSLVLIRRF
jgi:opacity protein-like surface antigen